MLSYMNIDSCVGTLKLVASTEALLAVLWQNEQPATLRLAEMVENKDHTILKNTQAQLNEYFQRKRVQFDLPICPMGTIFQQQVWAALQTIGYGQTQSYLDIAKRIGNEKAVRAVGGAIGKNPISIIVPCHRVIGANGQLTGFAGGLKNKQILLNLEQE